MLKVEEMSYMWKNCRICGRIVKIKNYLYYLIKQLKLLLFSTFHLKGGRNVVQASKSPILIKQRWKEM
jgi:hypothetical protein